MQKKQIDEWLHDPVTREVLKLVRETIEEIKETPYIDLFYPGEPQKTQENLVQLHERLYVWERWEEIFSGDFSYFGDEDVESEAGEQ